MITVFISALKVIFLLGFLVGIHEGGHFLVAKLCKVKVNEFSIGFGPAILKWQGTETKYALRIIPLGGFVSLEGEEAQFSDEERAFCNASILKRIAIVSAGAIVNIIFALIAYLIISGSFESTRIFAKVTLEGVISIFTNRITASDLTGPIGISKIVAQTNGIKQFCYVLAVISMSLGVTNLIPFPPLDGGKILLLLIEAVRRKKLKAETEAKISLIGLAILLTLSILVAYNDIINIF